MDVEVAASAVTVAVRFLTVLLLAVLEFAVAVLQLLLVLEGADDLLLLLLLLMLSRSCCYSSAVVLEH